MALTNVALATARTLLNDDNATVWTDPILLPKLQEAHRELQTDLWLVGSPVVREVTVPILVTLGNTDLGANQPQDLIAPTSLKEAESANGTWVDMTEVNYIPFDVAKTSKLVYWAWRGEKILFLGATASRYVVVFYRKLITIPTTANDPIGIIFGELYLGARTAALAAGSVGNKDVYDSITALAKANFEKVVAANRGQQKPIYKP
jgi:hypothetical protein